MLKVIYEDTVSVLRPYNFKIFGACDINLLSHFTRYVLVRPLSPPPPVGHGSSVPDTSGDEVDGMDETLIPVDWERSGQIVDDVIFEEVLLCYVVKVFNINPFGT